MDVDATIAALATPLAGAARGILRLSGPQVVDCLEQCFCPNDQADLRSIVSAQLIPGKIDVTPPLGALPCDLYLWPTRRSYTRQPSAELHLLGSPPLLNAALAAVCRAGARLARPGEFTLRAFLAGRIDLTQAEAVLAVIDATSGRDLEQALQQLAGGLAGPLHRLRDELVELLAELEAGLDFVEEDLQFVSPETILQAIDAAISHVVDLKAHLANRHEALGEPRVVLCGEPNVGKSSLLNALAGTPAAIVSDTPGSTRDYLVQSMAAAGLTCLLIDTAGVAPAPENHALPLAAQNQSRHQHRQADLRVLCLDASRPLTDWGYHQVASTAMDRPLVVWTKVDECPSRSFPVPGIATSSHTGEGLDELRQAIRDRLASDREVGGIGIASHRCRECLHRAEQALGAGRDAVVGRLGDELTAAELRLALDELGQIVGVVYTDDILDRIFSRFCIGK